MSAVSRQIFTCIFSLWFAFASTVGTIAHAQSANADFEAPIIEHEENVPGVLGEIEVFSARVVDNSQLKSVSLFYRYAGESDFTEVSMQPLAQSVNYQVEINTDARTNDGTAIEYYIRAEDEAGNVVLKGLSFEPFVRILVDPSAPVQTATTQNSPLDVSPKGKINWLYVGLGVLIVGGIAAAAGGSGSDPDPCCDVVIRVDQPQP